MYKSIFSIVLVVILLFALSFCSCPFCEKLEYKDTQTTIESEVEKAAQTLKIPDQLNEDHIIKTLRDLVEHNAKIFGANFASTPSPEDPNIIHAYYVYRDNNEIITLHNSTYNYEDAAHNSWYKKPYLLKKPLWSTPYLDADASGKEHFLITYSYPVIQNGNVVFIIAADYLLNTK